MILTFSLVLNNLLVRIWGDTSGLDLTVSEHINVVIVVYLVWLLLNRCVWRNKINRRVGRFLRFFSGWVLVMILVETDPINVSHSDGGIIGVLTNISRVLLVKQLLNVVTWNLHSLWSLKSFLYWFSSMLNGLVQRCLLIVRINPFLWNWLWIFCFGLGEWDPLCNC